jgi:formyl-CoA transferase
MGGFWARSGMAAMHTLPGSEPPTLRGAAGDHMSAAALAGGVTAALFERERTGRGRHVSTSLLRNGIWALSQDANITIRAGVQLPVGGRAGASNPIYNSYRTADDRWLWLLGLVPDPQWPRITSALGRDDWAAEERFSTMAGRAEHGAELKAMLDAEFATRTLDEWRAILEGAGVWWEPVATLAEVLDDPQAEATGAFIELERADGSTVRTIAGPITFAGGTTRVGRPPELGEHTEELLLSLGHDWPEIVELRESGALG